jgi:hypothetical protein
MSFGKSREPQQILLPKRRKTTDLASPYLYQIGRRTVKKNHRMIETQSAAISSQKPLTPLDFGHLVGK